MTSQAQAHPPQARDRKLSIYKGDPGMWSWVLHRITGVALFFYLFVHVLDTSMVTFSPETYNAIIDTYKSPIVGLLEIGLVALVLFHAFNGVRIILVDFWSKGVKYQRQMLWIVLGLWVVVFAGFASRQLFLLFSHL